MDSSKISEIARNRKKSADFFYLADLMQKYRLKMLCIREWKATCRPVF
jgi:hypothetical protein